MLFIIGIVVIGIFYYSKPDTEDQESLPTLENSPNYKATENCTTYSKPDIESTSEGSLETGNDYLVEDSSKFEYFYEITFKNGEKLIVLKGCLERK
tara:strand:+ start:54 stop:341 length:288 start_codon:yes stop_codon:yes gene_type:complete